MINQQELDILIVQLNKTAMDNAQLYAVQTILRKMQDAIKAPEQKPLPAPAPGGDDE